MGGNLEMPTAICLSCGASVCWRNTFGSRKPEKHGCGGKLIATGRIKVPEQHADASFYYRQGYDHALRRQLPTTFMGNGYYRPGVEAAYEAGYTAGKEAMG